MLTVIFALLALPMAQQTEPATPQPAPQVMGAPPAPETPAQAPARRRLDRLEVICSRRAPTGSRLDRTQCEPRDRAALEARAKRQETEDFINMSGIVKPMD